MKPVVGQAGHQPSSGDDDRDSLRQALAQAREEILNLRDEVTGARAVVAQARKDHDATFYLLDVTTRQLGDLKAALGYEPEVDVVDILHAIEISGAGFRRPDRTDTDSEIVPPVDGLGPRVRALFRRPSAGVGES